MPANGTRRNSNGNGPPRLPRWVTRELPWPPVAAWLIPAALTLAACHGPASSQALPASAPTVSARAPTPMTALPAPSASATPSTAAATGRAQTTTTAAAPRTGPSSANSALPLAPAQLPDFNVESWTAQTAGPAREVAGHDIELNECASVDGAATWQQQPYVGRANGDDIAILETYTFGTSAAARSAYAGVLSGMKSCQATSRALQTASHITPDAVSRQTATATDAAAFERTWTGVGGISAPVPQINHLYLTMRGTTVLVLHFDELGKQNSPYDVHNDPSVLSTLIDALTRLNGSR